MTGIGREVYPESREWSGGPPGVVGRLSWRVGGPPGGLRGPPGGTGAFLEGQEWLRGPPGGPGMVGGPSRKVGSGREALPEGREWSGGPPG